jgi:hypothetical protein
LVLPATAQTAFVLGQGAWAGNYGFAFGQYAIGADNSFAFGAGAYAQANEYLGSLAIGQGASAGPGGIAIGASVYTPAGYYYNAGVAIGEESNAGMSAVTLGKYATASDLGLAFGHGASVSAWAGIAIGASANSIGELSIAVGDTATSVGAESVALGSGSFAAGTNSVAIGRYSIAPSFGGVALGLGNQAKRKDGTTPDPVNSAGGDPILMLGNSSSYSGDDASRSNAFTIYRDGTARFTGALQLSSAQPTISFYDPANPIASVGQITFPTSGTGATTVVTSDATQTLTGKTLASPTVTGTATLGGTTAATQVKINGTTGNLTVGASTHSAKLSVRGSGAPASTTATPNGLLILSGEDSTNTVLTAGVDNTNGNPLGWLQARHANSGPAYYPLVLNPNGGNVGVGTTVPSAKLQVATNLQALNFNLGLKNFNGTENGANAVGIGFLNEGDSAGAWWKGAVVHERTGSYGVGSMHFLLSSATDTSTVTLADARMTITKDGNVGIGATTPRERLQLNGSITIPAMGHGLRFNSYWDGVAGAWKYQNNGYAAAFTQGTDGNVYVATSSNLGTPNGAISGFANRLTVAKNGNVGVGTSADPVEKLEVAGNIKLSGSLVTSGGILSLPAGSATLVTTNGTQTITGTTTLQGTATLGGGGIAQQVKVDGATGNVGIGVAPGSAKLNVAGQGVLSGSLTVQSDIFQNVGQGGVVGHYLYRDGAASATGWTSFGLRYTDTWNTDPAACRLSLITSGNEALAIRSNGTVGIGMTDPAEKLHVAGNIRTTGSFLFKGLQTGPVAKPVLITNWYGMESIAVQHESPTNLADYKILFKNSANGLDTLSYGRRGVTIEQPTESFNILPAPSQTADLFQVNNNLFKVAANGNVGIGTATPREKLQVSGSITIPAMGHGLRFNSYWDAATSTWKYHNNGYAAALTQATDGNIYIATSSNLGSPDGTVSGFANRLTVAKNGNVGVGTSVDPVEKLEVAGNIKLSGNLVTSGGTLALPDFRDASHHQRQWSGAHESQCVSLDDRNDPRRPVARFYRCDHHVRRLRGYHPLHGHAQQRRHRNHQLHHGGSALRGFFIRVGYTAWSGRRKRIAVGWRCRRARLGKSCA